MKIKISKSQWEEAGRKAGWRKEAQNNAMDKVVCPDCHGKKMIIEKIKNLGTLEYRDSTQPCSMCRGKGYITKEDHDSHMHSIGNYPCPFGNDKKDSFSKDISTFKKEAQGRMNRNEEEMYPTTGRSQAPIGVELTLDLINRIMDKIDTSTSNRNAKADFLDFLIESAKRKRKSL